MVVPRTVDELAQNHKLLGNVLTSCCKLTNRMNWLKLGHELLNLFWNTSIATTERDILIVRVSFKEGGEGGCRIHLSSLDVDRHFTYTCRLYRQGQKCPHRYLELKNYWTEEDNTDKVQRKIQQGKWIYDNVASCAFIELDFSMIFWEQVLFYRANADFPRGGLAIISF